VALGSQTSDPILGFIDILSSFDTGTDNDENSNSCNSSLHGHDYKVNSSLLIGI
jgi:hypothetical protein